jgi:hypothetical protein
MLNAISLVIEKQKNESDRIAKDWFFPPSILIPCEGDITLRTPGSININFFQVDKSRYRPIPKSIIV